jgi:siroheme synthase
MPGADYGEVSARLLEGGLPADLPCVIVSRSTGSQQQVRWSNVARLASEEKLPAPALLIVGRVASRDVADISAQFWGTNRKDPDLQQTSVS